MCEVKRGCCIRTAPLLRYKSLNKSLLYSPLYPNSSLCIKNAFNNYVDNYNSHDGKIKLKIYHTYKVSEICEKIAKSLKFNNEDYIFENFE